jgi:hypothetical protein
MISEEKSFILTQICKEFDKSHVSVDFWPNFSYIDVYFTSSVVSSTSCSVDFFVINI